MSHVLPLYPLSQGELLHKKERFVDAMFHAAQLRIDDTQILPFDVEQFLRGGFAQAVTLLPRERDLWFNRYVQNVVHHDVALQVQVEDHLLFARLLHVLARHAALPINIAQVSRQSGIPITTLNRHLAVLKNAQVLSELNAWDAQGAIKKVFKAPQMYMQDVGLHRWLLGADAEGRHNELLRHGVYNELQKQLTWNASAVTLSHMRAMNDCAVDMLLERADGTVVGIKITDAPQVTPQDTKGLLHCKERLGDRWHRGIVLHTGTDVMPLGNKMWLLPISALWSYDAIG
jgi:predicted AAA+ superfamily ATPase